MTDKKNLYILWTNDNVVTAKMMVFMYGINSKRKDWWENVTIILWGATAKLASADTDIQDLIKEAKSEGVHISACKACADQLGVTDTLEALDLEVIYWGEPLTNILKENEALITI